MVLDKLERVLSTTRLLVEEDEISFTGTAVVALIEEPVKATKDIEKSKSIFDLFVRERASLTGLSDPAHLGRLTDQDCDHLKEVHFLSMAPLQLTLPSVSSNRLSFDLSLRKKLRI